MQLTLSVCLNSGATLTINASGTLSETVDKGATVALVVKWGVITLVKQTVDLCDEIKNVDLECPLEKGHMSLTKEVKLPAQIPPVSIPLRSTREEDLS